MHDGVQLIGNEFVQFGDAHVDAGGQVLGNRHRTRHDLIDQLIDQMLGVRMLGFIGGNMALIDYRVEKTSPRQDCGLVHRSFYLQWCVHHLLPCFGIGLLNRFQLGGITHNFIQQLF